MRWLVVLSLLIIVVAPAAATKRLTVAQLEQILAADAARKKQDAAMAKQLARLELSERLSESSFARLNAYLPAGSKAALAFRLLADQSQFLELPPAEVPSDAAPDAPNKKEKPRAN